MDTLEGVGERLGGEEAGSVGHKAWSSAAFMPIPPLDTGSLAWCQARSSRVVPRIRASPSLVTVSNRRRRGIMPVVSTVRRMKENLGRE